MKNLIIIPFLLVIMLANGQSILRVNNIPGINAPYTTIQAAIAAAATGDIILVEGSPTAYSVGAVNLTKRLTIQGPGYFLDENTGIQASQQPATVTATSFILSSGSDGSVVGGMTFNQRIDVRASNIIIENSRFLGPTSILLSNAVPASNLLITGNYMTNGGSSISINANGQTFTNVIISNNLIAFSIDWSTVPIFGVIKNNIFTIGASPSNMSNCDVVNNIFLAGFSIGTSLNSTIRNNVFVNATQANADATNLLGVVQATLFVGLAGNTSDTQWSLKVGSPAIGAGALGEDCGIYGGVSPYKISGVATGQPTITNLNVPGGVQQNGTLNVKVSAKAN